jgi:hypothetical protein
MALAHSLKEALEKASIYFHEIQDSLMEVFRDKTLKKGQDFYDYYRGQRTQKHCSSGVIQYGVLLFLPMSLQKSIQTFALIFER